MSVQPIGIYDSGIGGLTVLKTLYEKFPNERFVYFGDTINLPYGSKSESQIIQYSRNIIEWFQKEINVKLIVAACHTSSALALEEISPDCKVPIIGTIYPLVKGLLRREVSPKIGIIATPASVKSLTHEKIFVKAGFQGEIVSISCPDFVPLIEADYWNKEALKKCAEIYLKVFEERGLDTLIYGCTHYPFIRSIIEEILPISVKTVDPSEYIASEVFDILFAKKLLHKEEASGVGYFFCSSDAQRFTGKIQKFLGRKKVLVTVKDVHSSCIL